MTSTIEEIDKLLAESESLNANVQMLQADESLNIKQVATVQSLYHDWFSRAHTLIPDYFKSRLRNLYDDPKTGDSTEKLTQTSIKQFIADPLAKKPEFNSAAMARAIVGTSSSRREAGTRGTEDKYVWTFPYDRYFLPKFSLQVNVIREARAFLASRQELDPLIQSSQPTLGGITLHPKIAAVATDRFSSGHYDDAISHSIIAVNEAVRAKSESTAKDGQALMKNAFSSNQPILRLSAKEEEQRAMMELFAAAWSAVRSPRAHTTQPNVQEAHVAIEWIAFASALMRLVDQAVKQDRTGQVQGPAGANVS